MPNFYCAYMHSPVLHSVTIARRTPLLCLTSTLTGDSSLYYMSPWYPTHSASSASSTSSHTGGHTVRCQSLRLPEVLGECTRVALCFPYSPDCLFFLVFIHSSIRKRVTIRRAMVSAARRVCATHCWPVHRRLICQRIRRKVSDHHKVLE